MKKISLLLCSLFILPVGVFAATNPKVTEINTTVDGDKISYTGVTETGAHAVMCKLYNSKDEEVDLLSSAVDNTKFEGEFTSLEVGTYTVACANYEGGEFKKVEVTIEDKKEEAKEEEYTLTDNENIVTFVEEANRTFTLNFIDYLLFTDEDLEATEISKELYNEVLGKGTKATTKYGKLLAFYEIEIVNDDNFLLHEGPFKIKIKLTDEMKKYDTFKLVYLDDDFNAKETIELKVDGDYLVGTLDHLSAYVLVGNKEVKNNPKTGDNVDYLILTFIASAIGLGFLLKRKNA